MGSSLVGGRHRSVPPLRPRLRGSAVSSWQARMEQAGKRYTKYEDAPMLATRALRLRQRTRRSKLWALRHVDLELDAGECLGIVGRNGSGKSTLLQLLAGVTAPTEGRVAVRGRVAPLIS